MKNFYTVFDVKSEHFTEPFCCFTDSEAIRSFQSILCDQRTIYGQHPEDFELFRIGNYNPLTASVSASPITCVIRGIDCLKNGSAATADEGAAVGAEPPQVEPEQVPADEKQA